MRFSQWFQAFTPWQLIACTVLLVATARFATAAPLRPGDVLVSDTLGSDPRILTVDPATGAFSIVATIEERFARTRGIAVRSDGAIFTVDAHANILRIIPDSDSQEIVSSQEFSVGTGVLFGDGVVGIDFDIDEQLIVLDGEDQVLFRVDQETGARTAISSNSPRVGGGLSFGEPNSFALDTSNSMYRGSIYMDGRGRITRVDPATGNRTTVADNDVGTGLSVTGEALAVEPNGFLLTEGRVETIGNARPVLLRVDPATGNRTILAGDDVGTGPWLEDVESVGDSIKVARNGDIFIADGDLLRVDPISGDRTLVLANDGVLVGAISEVAVFVPEPAAAVLLITGVLLAGMWVRRRRS